MNEDVFNMQVRKFLKSVGVTSQREIETAIRAAVADGRLKGTNEVAVSAVVRIPELGVEKTIDGTIELE